MICLVCAELRDGETSDTCPDCGTTLEPATRAHLDRLVEEKLKRRIADWQATRLLDTPTASRLTESLHGASAASVPVPLLEDSSTLEQKADAIAWKLGELEDWRPSWGQAFFQALEDAARAEREAEARPHTEEDGIGLASDSGQALFRHVDAGALGDGLDAMVALDDSTDGARDGTPRLHEYVWWFLGAVLVLGGSLMGVREAWRALGGIPRQLLVTGALFAYHAGFIGLGVFLSRRSASAGRVLASIGLALLPVVFVALSALVSLAPAMGWPVSAGAAGLTLLTLGPTGRLLYGASTGSLGVALLPSLLAGLPLMALGDAPWSRTLCAFAGVAAFGASAWRARREGASRAGLSVLTTSLYGAAALAVFSVASAPSGFEALSPGDPAFAGMTLWAMALAAVVAVVGSQPSAREAHPQAAPVVETLAHAVMACGALAAALAAFSLQPGVEPWVDLASALTPVAAALAFFVLEPRRRALVHPGVLALALAGVLLARLVMPAEPRWWMVGVAAVGAGLLAVARLNARRPLGFWLLGWGVVLSLASLPLTSAGVTDWGSDTGWPEAAAGALVAVAAHLTGGYRWRALHYLGGIAVLFGTFGAIDATGVFARTWTLLTVLTLAAGLYAVAGLLQEAWMRRAGKRDELLPLDDLSLAVASLGVLLAIPGVQDRLDTGADLLNLVLGCVPLVLASVLLLLRVRRDRSRLVSTLAAWGLALAVVQLVQQRSTTDLADRAWLFASLTLGLCTIAALRGRGNEASEPAPRGRRLLGWLRLPFPESGRPLYTDGFAAVAFLATAFTLPLLASWMQSPTEAERSQAVLAGALLTGSAVLAFLSRGFVTWRLRGSVGMLATAGLFITLTAVLNRVGRPLPPDVVALRLTLTGVGIWLLALATRRFGPRLGRLLENEPHGHLYHFVPHAGVAALGMVLAVGAWVAGGPVLSRALTVVPPLMPLGAALLALLLAFSFRAPGLAHLGLLLGLPGAALWAVHRTVLGHALVATKPPGGQWVRAEALEAARSSHWLAPEAWLASGETVSQLWYRAFAGIAAAGLVYAGAGLVLAWVGARFDFGQRLTRALHRWSGNAVGLVFLAAFFQPGLEAAVLALGSGLLLLAGRARPQGRLVTGLGLLLVIHALAQREPTVGVWPGPVLALVGLCVVALSPWVARWRGLDEGKARPRAQLGALFYGLNAAVYALASGGRTHPVLAGPWLLLLAVDGLERAWMRSMALPLTLVLVATTLFIGAYQWKGALSRVGAGGASTMAGLAALTGLSVALVAGATGFGAEPKHEALLTLHGTALALCTAGVAALAHVANRQVREGRGDIARGLAWGRDLWLIATGGLLALVVAGMSTPDEGALPLAGTAIGLAVAVSLHCAWREQTGRHVYFVQVAVVGVYALVRALFARDLRPEHDALFALALGFVLVGVTVLARRAGIPPVERATRRFAALLPVGMALVLPGEATSEAALLAGGSGLLYAALGAVERSRLFGSLAATACNVALLLGALSMDMEGLEVYLAPLGLLLLMLGQLFTSSLPRAARNAVRILGGLLLYVPAAAKLTLQIGQAADGTYAFVFGAACLLGVAAGMALHIRAYLALGTLFLTLDVVATLVHAGLRDHRLGFGVMTLTGLTIVGGRVLATLRRQELDQWVRRVRVALRGWD
ncbi:hypothetical protein [Archangium sp.]|uniref:hypothetical protein n=1 Tax=Archangium sp. TaxID=1872627 RepID=UPI002D6E31F7|nr:hypothetical protein [Archangium sp.]HYO52443.1 hypothetical protein [Archangium sp.]